MKQSKANEKWLKKQEQVKQEKDRREVRQNRMRYFWMIRALPWEEPEAA
jgi:hypothetical protein